MKTIYNRQKICSFIGMMAVLFLMLSAANAQGMSTENVRQSETEAGNVIADAVRTAANADIAFIPAAAFKQRGSAAKSAGAESVAGLLETPTDSIVIVSLRGAQILAALERAISFAPQPSSGFLQVSGLRFAYDSHATGGKRVQSVTLSGNAPLDAARTYKVATTRPLANGQQGYFQIWEKEQITGDTKKTIAEALTEAARAHGGSLSGTIDGRITQSDKR